MKLRKLTGLFALPAALALTALLAWWWLLHSGPGARWLIEKAVAATRGSLVINRVSGDLSSGLQLEGIRFEENGTRVDAEVLRIAVNIDLLPVGVEVTTLHAGKIRLLIRPNSEKTTVKKSGPWAFEMPFPLVFKDLELSGIEYLDGSGGEPVVVNSIKAAGSLNDALVLDQLSISHPEISLDLSGRVALASPHDLAVKFRTQGRLALEGRLDGSLESAGLTVDLADPKVHISGTLGQLLSTPAWELEVESPFIRLPPGSDQPAATLALVQAQTSGQWPHFDLDLSTGLEIPGYGPNQLVLSGSGNRTGFTAQKLTLQGAEVSLDATGTISWEDTLRLALDANLERLDLRTWIPDWPENHPVSGQFAVGWGGDDLAIDHFNLAVAGTALVANGRGIIQPGSGIVDVSLNWENFSWPIAGASPAVASKSGSIEIGGQPENWRLNGALDLQSGPYPPARLQLSGNGDTESLNLTVQEGQLLGGTFSGNVSWNWTGSQPFKAEALAQQLDITPLLSDYPGVLGARVALDGEVKPLRLAVDIQQLNGTVRGQTVTGQGGLTLETGRLTARQLRLFSGASKLLLDGSLYEPGGIDFAVDIDSLAQLSKDFQGSLAAQGNLSLDPASPRISISLSGQDLVLDSVRIDRIEARDPPGPGFEQGSGIRLSGLTIGQHKVETLSIGIGGVKPLERIAVNARVDNTDVDLDLAGSVGDWADPVGSGWHGEVTGFRIDHGDGFFLALEQPAAFAWMPGHFTLAQACHSGTGNARLCVASSWNDGDELSISADLAGIPVSLAEVLVDTEFRFSQVLSGTLNWSQSTAAGNKGAARFEISPGRISRVDDDELMLDTGTGTFGFELADGKLQKGNLDLAIPGTGEIDIDFNIPDFSLGSYSPVRGKVRVDIHDLGSLGPILPLFDSLKGALDIDVELSGILADPAFIGKASLTNGEVAISASGSTLSEINLFGDINDMDRSELNGTFRAGEGAGTITTVTYFEDLLSPVIELTLKGESLTIIDVPELNVIANPDFTLRWARDSLEINGRLFIPKARLAPTIIPRASAAQSADVVIVAGNLPESGNGSQRSSPLNIRGTLEVELGKQAEIDLKMAEVNVYGTTRFTWQGETLPLANGNFDIRGDIQAYGQLLKITQGRISFPEIPANNPHLNIRAEREIFGNSQIQKAGLMVAGTLKRPLIEPYTTPMTNKDRARTLLVTGSDFNYEQGVGAIAVGFYVLPRLYISYGIGVFEEGNVISVRYDLGKRFGVRVTSGQRDTGADLNYTIER